MPAIKVLGSMSFANRASLCSVERKLVSCIVWRAGRNSSEIKIWEIQSSRAWDELCINVMWFEEGDYRNLHLCYKSVSEGISKFVGIRIHLYQYFKISNIFCLSLEANLADRKTVLLLLLETKIFTPVIDKR
jgi:hypothetical protein